MPFLSKRAQKRQLQQQKQAEESSQTAATGRTELLKLTPMVFYEIARAHVGKQELNVFGGGSILDSAYDPDTDDMNKHFNDDGERSKQRKQTIERKKESKKKTSSKGASSSNGWCTFPRIMIISFAVFLFALAYMRLSEESFFMKQHYEEVDYYEILGLDRKAAPADVKKTFRKMAMKWHPDRNPNCGQECLDMMGKLNEAYLVLSNPELRSFHDLHGVKPPEQMIKTAQAKHGSHAKKGR